MPIHTNTEPDPYQEELDELRATGLDWDDAHVCDVYLEEGGEDEALSFLVILTLDDMPVHEVEFDFLESAENFCEGAAAYGRKPIIGIGGRIVHLD